LTAVHTVSFDNLGEVTELARGEFPEGEPLGRHFSVTRALPRILDLLEETGVRATFFVEGRNTELYPETLAGLAAAGHEVAYHGWCHEPWAELSAEEEDALLARGAQALGRPAGFRPPGGELNPGTLGRLRAHGFAYCSPAGEAPEVRDDVEILPFAWPLVDAFHYLPRFADLRGGAPPHPPEAFARELRRALDARGASCAVFHAFLSEPDDRFAVLRGHLLDVRARVQRGELWCAPFRDVAARA
jgi:peptidoglycan/xylan/chitin deacetylase (PgdA/CDA1 family)